MQIRVFEDKTALGRAAAHMVLERLQAAIEARGEAYLILATGTSQFEMLDTLVEQDIDWSQVTAFHLDEYIGLPVDHPASFRRYLKERFVDRVPALRAFHYIQGDVDDPVAECQRLGELIRRSTIDVACIGIGENGHIAFNDPPADFETEEPYIVVTLDEACRRQQLGEGWFPTLEDVPDRAISMSVRQIMKSDAIVCIAPDARKAEPVSKAVLGPVTPDVPASCLQLHPRCDLLLDTASAALLEPAG